MIFILLFSFKLRLAEDKGTFRFCQLFFYCFSVENSFYSRSKINSSTGQYKKRLQTGNNGKIQPCARFYLLKNIAALIACIGISKKQVSVSPKDGKTVSKTGTAPMLFYMVFLCPQRVTPRRSRKTRRKYLRALSVLRGSLIHNELKQYYEISIQ